MALPIITDQLFKEEYEKFQKLFKNIGTDTQFAEYLNQRYRPSLKGGKDKFSGDGIYMKRKRMKIKTPVQNIGSNPTALARQKKINKFLEKEITKANASEKSALNLYDGKETIIDKVQKKFKVRIFPESYPILKTIETDAEKIDRILKSMLIEDKPVKQKWANEVAKRLGKDLQTVKRFLYSGAVPTYEVIKDQGADFILKSGRTFSKSFFALPLAEQLTYATEMEQGKPVYTGGPKGKRYGRATNENVMEFARRSWNLNEGQGDIKFFDSKGKLIPWQFGLRLPFNNISFSYDGKLHSNKDLLDVRYVKKYFPEVHDTSVKLRNLKNKLIDNPFDKGKIKVEDLVRRIQVDAYQWSPNAAGLNLLHGSKGVRVEPFKNLSINTRDINQLGAGVDNFMRRGVLGKREGQTILKSISQALPGDETDIIQRQLTIADKVKKGTMFGYKDMAGNVRGLFESIDKPTILQIRKAVGCDNADGGRIELQAGGDLLACPAKKFQNDPVGFTTKVNEIQQPTSGITKFTNAALGFLKSGGVKTFGAGAAIGTAVGLVKAFRNDDPTTYLSNEDQQKSMLVDMATQPVSVDMDRPAILDYQLPALGVGIAGSTALAAPSTIRASKTDLKFASRAPGVERKKPGIAKTGLRVLGRGLGVAASPALLAPLAAGDIASQVAAGDSPVDIATDPLNYLYPAFADQTPKLTRGLSPTVRKVARLGLSRAALTGLSRLGIGGFAGSLAIQGLGLLDE
jgi:hypothetical protein